MNYLVGDKIKLVKFTDRFITPEYMDWLNNHSINRYLATGRFLVTREEVFVPKDNKNLMFSIMCNIGIDSGGNLWEDNGFNHYIGTISLHNIDWISRKGEVGYMIGSRKHAGKGIATEAVKLITDYAFNRLNLNKLSACVVGGNFDSNRVLEKNDYKLLTTIPQDYYLENEYKDAYLYVKLREWHKKI